jgi:hypothetical protein
MLCSGLPAVLHGYEWLTVNDGRNEKSGESRNAFLKMSVYRITDNNNTLIAESYEMWLHQKGKSGNCPIKINLRAGNTKDEMAVLMDET